MEESKAQDYRNGFTLQGRREEAIFMLHGFCSNSYSMLPLAQYLNQLGYTIIAVTLDGHERPDPELVRKSNYKGWIAKAKASYLSAKTKYRKLYLLGYSLGGAIAAILAKDSPARGLILIEPCLAIKDARCHLAFLAPWKKMEFEDTKLPNHNEKYLDGTGFYYTKSVMDLNHAARLARKSAKNQKQPIFATFSLKDTWVKQNAIDKFMKNSKREDNVYKIYQNSSHMLPVEPDYIRLAEDIDKFMEKTEKEEGYERQNREYILKSDIQENH